MCESAFRLQFWQWSMFGWGKSLIESCFHTPGAQLFGRVSVLMLRTSEVGYEVLTVMIQ